MRWRTFLGGLSVTLLSLPAAADEPNAPQGAVVLQEIEVKARKDPGVRTLEVREVREGGAVDLGEALAEQGVASKVRRGPIANDVVLRWFQRDNVPVVVDGTLVHGACPNRMDPPSFHVDYAEVERVGVKRGPFDVSVPGGLGGAVSVDLRRPPPGFGAEANLSFSSNRHGEGSGVLSYGASWGDVLGGFAAKYGMPYLTGAGRTVTSIYPDTSMNRYRDTSGTDTAYAMRSVWARAGAKLRGGKDRLELSYAYQGADSVIYPYLLMDAIYDDTHRVAARYEAHGVGPFADLGVQLFFSDVDHLMNDARRCSSAADPAGCSGLLPHNWSMETHARARVFGGRATAAAMIGGEALRFGVDAYSRAWDARTTRFNRMMKAYGEQASIPDASTFDIGLHARYAHDLGGGFRLGAGVRLDVTRSEAGLGSLSVDQAKMVEALYQNAHGAGQPTSALDVLPAANVEVDYRVAKPVSLYLGLGHAARTPDPQERYFALSGMAAMGTNPPKPGRVGRPDLAPARNTEVDLGVKLQTPRALVQAQGFFSNVNDAIIVSRVTGADGIPSVTYDNVLARLAGAELAGRVALPLDLYLSAAVSYTHGWNVTADTALQETPPLSGNASLRWDIDRFFVEAMESFAAEQDRVDEGMGEQTTPAWAITTLRAGASYEGFRLMAAVKNLFDQEYLEHLNYLRDPFASGVRVPEPGRTFSVTLQYTGE